MKLSALTAISPVDGRYREITNPLAHYFSEQGLIRYRVLVEIEYIIAISALRLPQLPSLTDKETGDLRKLYLEFSETAAESVKRTEKVTNHDVKAVEYWIKENLPAALRNREEFVHFGLTSQDINNTAIPLSLKEASEKVLLPSLRKVIEKLNALADEWKSIPMLARTHGQPASPTLLGKEIYVFAERLSVQEKQLLNIPWSAKFGGATGNFNAHHVAYPDKDWTAFGNDFLKNAFGLQRSQFTTQIEHYDNLAAYCDATKRINTILLDLCRDMWTYVSLEYFKQKLKAGEVGSSAMPHKVNPIDFENAEGNIGIANALLEHLAAKLPVSRLQRDLTDSTVLRNIGIPFAHTLIAHTSLLKGLSKLILNEDALKQDLDNNWAVVAEAIQTILRREGYPKPYEALKALTRTNLQITKDSLHKFIGELDINEKVKQELRAVSPHNYTGTNPKF